MGEIGSCCGRCGSQTGLRAERVGIHSIWWDGLLGSGRSCVGIDVGQATQVAIRLGAVSQTGQKTGRSKRSAEDSRHRARETYGGSSCETNSLLRRTHQPRHNGCREGPDCYAGRCRESAKRGRQSDPSDVGDGRPQRSSPGSHLGTWSIHREKGSGQFCRTDMDPTDG